MNCKTEKVSHKVVPVVICVLKKFSIQLEFQLKFLINRILCKPISVHPCSGNKITMIATEFIVFHNGNTVFH